VRRKRNTSIRRTSEFFYISLSHDSLENHYKTNFALIQHHKYSLAELDNMMPFERQLYLILLRNYIEEENEKHKQKK